MPLHAVTYRSEGTFGEFNTKVLQFGYVAFFSVAFPLGALAATATNIVELRLDAYKFMFALRRPAWEGADGIGSWKLVLQAYARDACDTCSIRT